MAHASAAQATPVCPVGQWFVCVAATHVAAAEQLANTDTVDNTIWRPPWPATGDP
ncbi:MAG: hypothetical protein QOE61_3783 [Micromonosporaceae bacterium]|nr:hypothetical protein [Micromonosporaceae bacterium]